MNHVLLRLFISESLNSHMRAIAINSIFFLFKQQNRLRIIIHSPHFYSINDRETEKERMLDL